VVEFSSYGKKNLSTKKTKEEKKTWIFKPDGNKGRSECN